MSSTNIRNTCDPTIDYAVGKHRNSLYWKNTSGPFSELAKRCSRTRRTAETFAEYEALNNRRDKDLRDKIKDIGGFVPGYLIDGKRGKKAVGFKQIGAFDADYALAAFIQIVERIFPDIYWFIYTTHSHSSTTPRFRLIVLFSRDLTPDEYEPVCRKIAEKLGIEQFDSTTYELNRLMYWPSSSKDGEFIFKENIGAPLDVDQFLESYVDWRNTIEWPVSIREKKVLRSGIREQADPLEKPGFIGAFCRRYTITEAIEKFLPHIYAPCDEDNRWTFIGGSTHGGLIVYDDKFAYSHHGTDPASRILCNAFDLVRIHLFGDLDGE